VTFSCTVTLCALPDFFSHFINHALYVSSCGLITVESYWSALNGTGESRAQVKRAERHW